MILTINVYNSFTYLSKTFNALKPYVQNKIIKSLSYYKKSGRFTEKIEIYLLTNVSERRQTFEKYCKFPTGLLNRVLLILASYNIEYELKDNRPLPPEQYPISDYYDFLERNCKGLSYRDYQDGALEAALKDGRGIINHSTGAGKTVILGGIIYCTAVKTLVICTGITHVTQLSDDIRKMTGKKVTVCSGGRYDTSGHVVIANAQAILALRNKNEDEFSKLMKLFESVILDECHHAGSSSYRDPFYYATNAYYRYGLSGTVYREDGSVFEIFGAIGTVLHRVDYSFLTEKGYISEANFLVIDPMCDYLNPEEESWPTCLDAGIINNEKRNEWIKKICQVYQKRKKKILVISPLRVEHGKKLNEMIPGSIFLYGGSDGRLRKDELERFRNSKFDVLISSTIFDEVVNLPDVGCVIMAGGGKAHNAVYQRIGRGIRKAEGKDHVDIIIPWDSHSYILLSQSEKIIDLVSKVEVWKHRIKYLGSRRPKRSDALRDQFREVFSRQF
jgi:superfamily II DNA or RNA helicase